MNSQDPVSPTIVFTENAQVPKLLLEDIDLDIISSAAINIKYSVITKVKTAALTFYTISNSDSTRAQIGNVCNAVSGMLKLYNYTQKFTMTYLLLDVPKLYDPNSTETVASRQFINSGYTDTDAHAICIFRVQEVAKVTIHELIHLFNQDHACHGASNNSLCATSVHSPQEAYTEFLARLIYSLWTGSDIQKQFHFTLHQAAKILHHSGWKQWNSKCMLQETYAFEYYVQSAALMWTMATQQFNPFTRNYEQQIENGMKDKNFRNTIEVLLACSVFDNDLRMTLP